MGASKADNAQSAPAEEHDRKPADEPAKPGSADARSASDRSNRPAEAEPGDQLALTGQSIDELIEDVESVCGSATSDDVDIEEYQPPESASAQPADPSRDPALQEIDEALADNVESLLHGDFEAVSAVLDDVFDDRTASTSETAEPSQDADGDKASPAADASEPNGSDDDHAATDEPENGPRSSSAGGDIAAETDADDSETSDPLADAVFTAPEDSGPHEVDAAEATVSRSSETVDHDAARLEPPSSTPAVESPPAASVEEPTDTATPEPAIPEPPVLEATGDAALDKVEAAPTSRLRFAVDLASRIRDLVQPALRMMSLPMQFVPPRFRPIVDWIALSLVFWVPIVWIVALFVV